jgi:glycosyltransferase involved in cell wall biosynthesis
LGTRETKALISKTRVLFVGRLEERKGIDTIIAALPAIMESGAVDSFDIVGDDQLPDGDGVTYRQIIERRFGSELWFDKIHLHGHVDQDQLDQFYSNCSIFIAPSKYESFGLIYLEAMRFSKPCIGTTAGGIPEVVANNVTGILIEPGNSEELAQAVLKLCENSALRRKFGNAGRQRFLDSFTVGRFAERIVQHVGASSSKALGRVITSG